MLSIRTCSAKGSSGKRVQADLAGECQKKYGARASQHLARSIDAGKCVYLSKASLGCELFCFPCFSSFGCRSALIVETVVVSGSYRSEADCSNTGLEGCSAGLNR